MFRLLNSAITFFNEGKIKPISPVRVFTPDEVQDAFTFMQLGQHIGKIVIEFPQPFEESTLSQQVTQVRKKLEFDSSASYLLVGGLGGLGRAIGVWMIEHCARHLVFLSPSAGTYAAHLEYVHELKSMGCSVQLVRGSVADTQDVKRAITTAVKSAPLKGVLQMSMVLRDQSFSKMSFQEWNTATSPKIQGTWNLHHELASTNADLDFFVLFSSISAIIGLPGQANYASANTFLSAFAQYRSNLGLPTFAINIGGIKEVGFVAENEAVLQRFNVYGLHWISEQELLDALSLAIMSGKKGQDQDQDQGQFVDHSSFVLGLASTVPINTSTNTTIWKDRRMAFYHNHCSSSSSSSSSSSPTISSLQTLLKTAKSSPDILSHYLLAHEIGLKLFSLLLKPSGDLDISMSLADLGMDSLVAVEMRAWWRQSFGFDVSVLEMLGMGTLEGLGRLAEEGLRRIWKREN